MWLIATFGNYTGCKRFTTYTNRLNNFYAINFMIDKNVAYIRGKIDDFALGMI